MLIEVFTQVTEWSSTSESFTLGKQAQSDGHNRHVDQSPIAVPTYQQWKSPFPEQAGHAPVSDPFSALWAIEKP